MTKVRIVCGATASRKSAVALHLAQESGAEIFSIDSMKLYRGLDIGTAKPPPDVLAATRHHLIDVREPWEHFSVAQFIDSAETIIRDCAARNVPLIGEGGTALYLKAISEGIFDGPGRNPELRAQLEAEAEQIGVGKMHDRLATIDPQAAGKIMNTDVRRIVRALEVHALSGKPISEWQQQWGVARTDMDVRLACIRMPRKTIYARIDRRVDWMLANGWSDECQQLLTLSQPLSSEALQALGYRTLFAHLRGEMDFQAARDRICWDTHHFARRQLNWYRRMPKLTYIDISEDEPVEKVAERVLKAWE